MLILYLLNDVGIQNNIMYSLLLLNAYVETILF